jgi:hypothetical protein
MQADRDWRGELVVFERVDVVVLVKSEVYGTTVALPLVVRDAENASVATVTADIRRHLSPSQRAWWLPPSLRLPGIVRCQAYRLPRLSPERWRRVAGTACLTSVEMFGSDGGWGIPITNYPVQVTLGGIAERPAIVNDEVEPREYLSVTLSIGHDTVDGALAARFAERFRPLVERSAGLEDPKVPAEA